MDAWRNHYDSWKLASPDDGDPEGPTDEELAAVAEDYAVEQAERAREDAMFDREDRDEW